MMMGQICFRCTQFSFIGFNFLFLRGILEEVGMKKKKKRIANGRGLGTFHLTVACALNMKTQQYRCLQFVQTNSRLQISEATASISGAQWGRWSHTTVHHEDVPYDLTFIINCYQVYLCLQLVYTHFPGGKKGNRKGKGRKMKAGSSIKSDEKRQFFLQIYGFRNLG